MPQIVRNVLLNIKLVKLPIEEPKWFVNDGVWYVIKAVR